MIPTISHRELQRDGHHVMESPIGPLRSNVHGKRSHVLHSNSETKMPDCILPPTSFPLPPVPLDHTHIDLHSSISSRVIDPININHHIASPSGYNQDHLNRCDLIVIEEVGPAIPLEDKASDILDNFNPEQATNVADNLVCHFGEDIMKGADIDLTGIKNQTSAIENEVAALRRRIETLELAIKEVMLEYKTSPNLTISTKIFGDYKIDGSDSFSSQSVAFGRNRCVSPFQPVKAFGDFYQQAQIRQDSLIYDHMQSNMKGNARQHSILSLLSSISSAVSIPYGVHESAT